MDRLQLAHDLLGTAAHDGDVVEAEEFDDLGEEVSTAEQRFEQGDLDVLADQGQGNAREAGAGADVADRHSVGHDLREDRAVQQVPFPQAGHLTWADQAALHTRVGEQLGVPDRIVEAIAEHLARLLGRGGKLRCLRHGDRPSVPQKRIGR